MTYSFHRVALSEVQRFLDEYSPGKEVVHFSQIHHSGVNTEFAVLLKDDGSSDSLHWRKP